MALPAEKEKRKQPRSRRRWLWRITVACLIAVWLIFMAANAFGAWRLNGEVKTTLDESLVPTAEYLLEHPIPTPPINEISANGDNTRIWIIIPEPKFEDFCGRFLSNSEVYINSQRVGDLYVQRSILLSLPGACVFTVEGQFSGLYLVELQLKENVFSTPLLTHMWAIQIP